MSNEVVEEEWSPKCYVGQHETKRSFGVTRHLLDKAQEANYDMLTTAITADAFQTRVLILLSDYLSNLASRAEDIRRGIHIPPPVVPALTYLDTPLSPGDITSQLLAFTSSWIDLASPDPVVAHVSKQVLSLEVNYAAFVGVEYLFIPGPRLYHGEYRSPGLNQYARAVQEALSVSHHMTVHVCIPMITGHGEDAKEEKGASSLSELARPEYVEELGEKRASRLDIFDSWDAWHKIRTFCKYNSRLFIALDLPKQLPVDGVLQFRWHSEPIRLINMPESTFVPNAKGYPTLTKNVQNFIQKLMRLKTPPWILLTDVGSIPGTSEQRISRFDPKPGEAVPKPATGKKLDDPTPHLRYVRYLITKQPPRTLVEKYGAGYQDFLQAPLQPLADNLESVTYEVFEKDPVKYRLYEAAIRSALRDWKDLKKPTSGPGGKVVVAVAGAGRGPLVTRAIRAANAEAVAIEVWAVEKNPNAYVLLQQHNREDWNNKVTVVHTDMRAWKGPSGKDASGPEQSTYPIDIVISELLGSFADNELSPECLDGILHLLAPHGISIPQNYSAFLTPMAAPKIHADISNRASYDPQSAETSQVVWLHQVDYLSLQPSPMSGSSEPPTPASFDSHADPTTPTKSLPVRPPITSKSSTPFVPNSNPLPPSPNDPPLIQPTWTFHHSPLAEKLSFPVDNSHNIRHCRLEFPLGNRGGVCHGLGGFFESVLYEVEGEKERGTTVMLSTNPETMDAESQGMISWFPIWFPLKTPIQYSPNSTLTVEMWRQTDDRKVWYEWIVETWLWNVDDRSAKTPRRVRAGMSELHSSKGIASLM